MPLLADTTWDFGDFMLGVLWIFFFVIWIWLLIMVFSDVFRRHDIHGGLKTVWVIFVLLVPYLGVFVYLLSQGHGMAERAAKGAVRSRRPDEAAAGLQRGGRAREARRAAQQGLADRRRVPAAAGEGARLSAHP